MAQVYQPRKRGARSLRQSLLQKLASFLSVAKTCGIAVALVAPRFRNNLEVVTLKTSLSLLLVCVLLVATTFGQTPTPDARAAKIVQPTQTMETSEPAPALSQTQTPAQDKTAAIKIPDGTPIEIEAPYTLSSMDFKPEDKISFRVVDAIKLDGVTVVEQGATATGIVLKSKRGGHWGKAGLFVWTMQSVTAIDGSQVPVRATSVRLRGDSKGAKVATAMIITGALMPLIAPVALLHGFKRGENAYIPAGKRYTIFVDQHPAQTIAVQSEK